MNEKLYSIAEQAMMEALEKEDLSNVEGFGEPLDLSGNPYEAAGWSMSHKIMKNAGIVPREVQLKKDIAKWRQELADHPEMSELERRKLIKKIQLAEIEVNIKLEQARRL